MLILSRKPNQEIVIGQNIRVAVLRIRGGRVRLGVEAPREQNVRRGELKEMQNDECRMQNEKAHSLTPSPSHSRERQP